ncbi:hypothetical protein Tco_0007464 [Tanacetum coccineum]
MVAFLEKSTRSEGFHQVIDFSNSMLILFMITKKPDVYVSFLKQFWRSAEATTDDNGEVKIIATIDGHSMTITEASLRRCISTKEVALFPTMLDVLKTSTSPSRITSSPSPSPEPSPSHSPKPLTQQLHESYHCCLMRVRLKTYDIENLVTKLSDKVAVLEDDLRKTKKTYSSALTKLILRVKKLEARVKIGKSRKRAKRSREGKLLNDLYQEVYPTEVIQDQGSSEKGSAEVSTAGATKGIASEVPVVSTAEVNISTAEGPVTYRRRSEEKRIRKDKGKVIMTEPEPKKKSKKELEQESLSFDEAIRLQEQMDEEQRAQIARGEEIPRQWDEEERQRAMSEVRHLKHGSKRMKSSEKIEEEDVDIQKEVKEVAKESRAKRKKSLPRKSTRGTVKRQKMEEDAEKGRFKDI